MEIGYVVSELWRLRSWVALGLIVGVFAAVGVLYELPSFEPKSYELGAAYTEVLVEPSESPLGVLGTDAQTGENLVGQAGLYARLLRTPPVTERIAQAAGVPPGALAISIPQKGEPGREVPSEQRGNELVVEGNSYRILATPDTDLAESDADVPVISISTQAPTAEEAVRLADGAVNGLRDYVSDTAAEEGVARRMRFRQLGPASGGLVTQNASLKVAGMAFIGGLIAWTLLVLVVARLRAGWREAQAAERLEAVAPRAADAPPQPVDEHVPALRARTASDHRAAR